MGKVFTGSTPSTKDETMWGGSYYFVKPSDMTDGARRVLDTEKKLTQAATNTTKGRLLPAGTTCVVCIGTIGKLCQLHQAAATNQQINSIVVDRERFDPDYIYYLMSQSIRYVKVVEGGSASGREHVKKSTFEEIELRVLPLGEQRKVGELLNVYDNLIENNNRRIAILEDMAQSLYREWFVKFRFPGHENVKFKDSPLGQIPEGWEVKAATDVIEFAPKMSLPKGGEKPFVAMPSISTSSMIIGDIEMRAGNSGTKFKNGDTLMARITPCLQNGKIGFVQHLDEENPIGFGSTEFIVMRSMGLTPEFVYCLARSDSFRGNAINSMAGADGRQRVKNDCFKSYYLAVPPKDILNQFSALAEPAFKEIFALSQKNNNLRKQRDMILPKLLSGSIEL